MQKELIQKIFGFFYSCFGYFADTQSISFICNVRNCKITMNKNKLNLNATLSLLAKHKMSKKNLFHLLFFVLLFPIVYWYSKEYVGYLIMFKVVCMKILVFTNQNCPAIINISYVVNLNFQYLSVKIVPRISQ